jgi:hypothetical protein
MPGREGPFEQIAPLKPLELLGGVCGQPAFQQGAACLANQMIAEQLRTTICSKGHHKATSCSPVLAACRSGQAGGSVPRCPAPGRVLTDQCYL